MMSTFPLIVSAALVFSQSDARVSYDTAKVLVEECTPRDAGTPRGRLAANRILDAASAAGADVRRDIFRAKTPRGEKVFTNLYGEINGEDRDAEWVVLVSHYDTKPGVDCPGANDGASTSGLLVGIANALASSKGLRGNVMLVWTDGEECMLAYDPNDGLWGARRAARFLVEKKRKVKAVICLDMLGDRDLSITVPKNGTPSLIGVALAAARKAGLANLVKRGGEIVTDDHVPFLEVGFPAIDLIGVIPDDPFMIQKMTIKGFLIARKEFRLIDHVRGVASCKRARRRRNARRSAATPATTLKTGKAIMKRKGPER